MDLLYVQVMINIFVKIGLIDQIDIIDMLNAFYDFINDMIYALVFFIFFYIVIFFVFGILLTEKCYEFIKYKI
jgi:hypothetical protein